MSHYSQLETKLESREHLVQALADLGFAHVEVHDRPQPLVGWRGRQRQQLAEVIIRKQHIGQLSNDVGFVRDDDGHFRALISDFDSMQFNAAWLGKLHQRYAYHVSCERLAEQGFNLVTEEQEKDGTVRLTLRRMT